MLETLGDQYVLTARAKGLRPTAILRRHVLRNAMLPTVTLIALSLATSSPARSSSRPSSPGLASAARCTKRCAVATTQSCRAAFLMLTLSIMVFNLLADPLYGRLDPRVRR